MRIVRKEIVFHYDIKNVIKEYDGNGELLALARQLRLVNKLTDDIIKLLIEECSYDEASGLTEQIKLAGKLTDSNIELLIKELVESDDVGYMLDLMEQLPDDYKPTDEVIKILQEKGYEVLD